jgi:hypothetical protein
MPGLIGPRRRPCSSCPYRRDVPSGLWSAEEYDKLCLAQHERLLTQDLRWVPVGEIRTGDEVMAFGPRLTGTSRRQMMPSLVVRSISASAECVRVFLDDGTSVVCTVDHPWLVQNVRRDRRFLEAGRLMGGLSMVRGDHRRVVRLFDTWGYDTTRNGGWLAGMYDGEGSLRESPGYGSRVTFNQLPGPVLAEFECLMAARGFKLYRSQSRVGVVRLEINVTSEVARALGMLRPMRLLSKWHTSRPCRSIALPQVVAVEPVGVRDIQVITTADGTYIGEGFAMHNCGYDGSIAEQAMAGATAAFFCHQQDGNLCAGWVGCHDMHETLAIRLHPGVDRVAVVGYQSPVPLFASGAEAAEHGKREINTPGAAARRKISQLVRQQERRGSPHSVTPASPDAMD